ncbi:MAG: hypothetical protein ACK4WH_08560 [Phycisphaerales bacterium]
METDKNPGSTLADPTERTVLNILLSGPGRSLDQLAACCGTDILALAELVLTPRFQAALEAIRFAAAALAETRALACGQVALAALSATCDQPNADPAERRRAAAVLARFIPKPSRSIHTPTARNAHPDNAIKTRASDETTTAREAFPLAPTQPAPRPAPSEHAPTPEPLTHARARDRPTPALAA